ncbi:hypothetical protein F2Q70_00021413 [Brassica cretica]|uniref:Uncharacterized protein n=1 Tax=Brassica cretica TaxID=69181 RepID=A0A8S9GS79_BRACR|nr:hypothetical protein F2Q70_00021413 [Brassica cretica]
MATSQVNPSNLKIGRCKEVVVAHLFLFFETRNLKKRDELIWRVDMLFGREEHINFVELMNPTACIPNEKNSNIHVRQPLLCVSVFDKVTNLLHDKLEPLSVEPKAMVATNINPKFAGGKTATLFMFCGGGDGSLTTSKDGGVKKLESVMFQEINSYFHNSTPHVHPLSKVQF